MVKHKVSTCDRPEHGGALLQEAAGGPLLSAVLCPHLPELSLLCDGLLPLATGEFLLFDQENLGGDQLRLCETQLFSLSRVAY